MFKHRLSLKSMTYPIAVRSTSVSGSIARVSSSASYQNLSIAHSSSGEAIELPEGSPEQECIDRLISELQDKLIGHLEGRPRLAAPPIILPCQVIAN